MGMPPPIIKASFTVTFHGCLRGVRREAIRASVYVRFLSLPEGRTETFPKGYLWSMVLYLQGHDQRGRGRGVVLMVFDSGRVI